jgi:hypothetical protein
MGHVRLEQPEKSAVAEHLIDTAHPIDFNGTSKLGMSLTYVDRLVKEAVEVLLHPNNFNTDEQCTLSSVWRLVIDMLEGSSGVPTAKKCQELLGTQIRQPAFQ